MVTVLSPRVGYRANATAARTTTADAAAFANRSRPATAVKALRLARMRATLSSSLGETPVVCWIESAGNRARYG